MIRNLAFFLISLLLFTQCKDDKSSEVIVETQEQTDAKTITQKDIEALKYVDFGLSSESQKGVNDWQKFQELNIQIDLLKKGDLAFFKGDPLLLKTFLLEFSAEMPKALQTNEIMARITALETKAQKLNSFLKLHNTPKQQKLIAIKELLVTVSHLNLQINKKYEFEKNNILKPE
ncbi:hypothetical protein [Psychroserpens sp. SPM9]|uniref:hypothetical protein n=1 Tax=Psychroserpens sp. SPM9 TaxID=2975598 RepID=UPI0021A3C57B|nr:hypothetical protein [Psychroserpens sp. SPM9]MDG5490548.1 hypothetical protein [Psychroserpens sp. SPM9]